LFGIGDCNLSLGGKFIGQEEMREGKLQYLSSPTEYVQTDICNGLQCLNVVFQIKDKKADSVENCVIY
jgi:hypothetical protein